MSMSHPPTDWTDWTDDRTTDHDPHDLVPDGFVDAPRRVAALPVV